MALKTMLQPTRRSKSRSGKTLGRMLRTTSNRKMIRQMKIITTKAMANRTLTFSRRMIKRVMLDLTEIVENVKVVTEKIAVAAATIAVITGTRIAIVTKAKIPDN